MAIQCCEFELHEKKTQPSESNILTIKLKREIEKRIEIRSHSFSNSLENKCMYMLATLAVCLVTVAKQNIESHPAVAFLFSQEFKSTMQFAQNTQPSHSLLSYSLNLVLAHLHVKLLNFLNGKSTVANALFNIIIISFTSEQVAIFIILYSTFPWLK